MKQVALASKGLFVDIKRTLIKRPRKQESRGGAVLVSHVNKTRAALIFERWGVSMQVIGLSLVFSWSALRENQDEDNRWNCKK